MASRYGLLDGAADAGPAGEHELKVPVAAGRVAAVAAQLAALCRPDPLYPDGVVVTVSFDTPGLAALAEKLDGDRDKAKVRLRWYEAAPAGGPPRSAAFLEAKLRRGRSRDKVRLALAESADDLAARPLDDPSWLALPPRLAAAGLAPPPGLAPWMSLRYRRRRWIEPLSGRRVSLDCDLAVLAVNRRRLPAAPPPPRPGGVVEVKGPDGSWPPRLAGVLALAGPPGPFSKFAEGLLDALGRGADGERLSPLDRRLR